MNKADIGMPGNKPSFSVHNSSNTTISDFVLDNLDSKIYSRDNISIYNTDVLTLYDKWEPPVVIISDGPYGLSQFPGDPATPEELPDWYEPHIKAWSEKSTPLTTLWFWNSEIGWANVHPVLKKHGWTYRNCHIWDKGIAHVAGNTNTRTLRKFPVVTEVCVQYVKEPLFKVDNNVLTMKEWLRYEWERSGIPLNKTNEACGVKDAATRKYFTKDHLWYYPPVDAFERLVTYCNKYGNKNGYPYFSIDGINPLTSKQWESMRSKFYCEAGVSNVWREPAVRGFERLKNKNKCIHNNQKPLRLIELILRASSDVNDMIWEPFGGLCSVAIASHKLGRRCLSAEIRNDFYKLAIKRLETYDA
jgi:site-specific DNA-methyltransferase (adenine-specific)